MNIDLQLPSPIQVLNTPEWAGSQHIHIKRDDLIHPIVSGNKARKLERLIQDIRNNKPKHLLTMGGNRSNFLHALAYLCHQEDIPLSAFIRGHKPENFTRTLQDLSAWNTELHFVDKIKFQKLRGDKAYANRLAEAHSAQWLPEGGSDTQALQGIIQGVAELEKEPDTIFVPIGTGCTALGLALGIQQRGWNSKVIGIVVLKGADGENGILQDMQKLAAHADKPWPNNLYLEHSYCGKGFGKQSAELKQQQVYFEKLWGIALDPVYTIKMCNAFRHYNEINHPHLGRHVLLWHTGGLQGNS